MKKILFISCFLASVATYSCYVTEQTTPSDSRPKSILEQAKTSYGSYRLDSLLASPILSDERKAAFQEADLDNDGLITQEEYEKFAFAIMDNDMSVLDAHVLQKKLGQTLMK